MLDYLKELLFGPDYEEIIRQKNTQIFNLEHDHFKYELQIDELIRKFMFKGKH